MSFLNHSGTLYVAEVESRCSNINDFLKTIERFGFQLKENNVQKYFFLAKFSKIQNMSPKATMPRIYLKPCLYKKRWIEKVHINVEHHNKETDSLYVTNVQKRIWLK
jgi:deoxyadenosine/deoxycytidine kinase